MDRSGQIFEGRYHLQRPLGQGGMATVYAALDQRLDKAVAVKVLCPERAATPKAAQRFVQEARATSRVRHANVIDVTDFGLVGDGAAYMVMELLRGEDLAATLEREGPLPWARVGPIALQICAALAAAHRVGVLHRDIKPSNCFRLHSAGNPDFIKVLDFGIAKVTDPRRSLVEPTTAGTVLGTPEYMAPEVAVGAEATPLSDLYALGAVIYKLLTGVPLFVGDSYLAVLSKQIFEPPIPPRRRAPAREIPEAVEALVLRALAKDPADRFSGMADLAAAIADALPQRPAVELWIDPGAGEPTESLVAPAPAHGEHGTGTLAPATSGQGELSGAPEPARAGRTVPLPVGVSRPRRGPTLALAGAAGTFALVGALAGARLAGPEDGAGDVREGTFSLEQGGKDTPEVPAWNANTARARDQRLEQGGEDTPAVPPGPAARSDGAGDPREGTWSLIQGEEDMTRAPQTPAAAPAPPVQPSAASVSRAAPNGLAEPDARRYPRSDPDVASVHAALAGATRAVRTCALEFDMMRGEIALAVSVDDAGRLARVSVAPGSRGVEPGALACIRKELAPIRVSSGPGEVIHTFDI